MNQAHTAAIHAVMPAMTGLAERLSDRDVFRRLMAAAWMALIQTPELQAPEPDVAIFLYRNGGPRLLQLAAAQPAEASGPLLGRLRMSRTELAAVMGVSRPHLNLMLRDGEAMGLLKAGRGEVQFSARLSDRYGRHHARQFEAIRRAALSAGLVSEM
ncbi:MAG: helix-turn-helix domain-containing protein [Proteobacteria bacterium]|nr:helix-turn-helix domain-containing protein [Pseudomonadota bacterium]